jgi:hypothetical protein
MDPAPLGRWRWAIIASLTTNIVLVALVVALLASGTVAGSVGRHLHLASQSSVAVAQDSADQAEADAQIADSDAQDAKSAADDAASNVDGLQSTSDDLDGRIATLEQAIGLRANGRFSIRA